MATNKFAVYTERDLLTIIDGLSNDTLRFTIPELKELQSELINRRVDGQQITAVSNLIMKQMSESSDKSVDKKKFTKRGAAIEQAEKENIFLKEPEVEEIAPEKANEDAVEPKKKTRETLVETPEVKPEKEKFAYIDEEEYEDYYDDGDERFPILGFLTAFYKIVGWLGVVAIIGATVILSIIYELQKPIVIMAIAGSVVVSAVFILLMSAKAEKIALDLEKEKHLRRIRDLLRKQ
ncbi:MAG: hypothetical protein PHE51_00040 [Eubacteriales bacterium]|nr:hypothetical protein [Eubacteriales bacterium]